MTKTLSLPLLALLLLATPLAAADALPFQHKVETYRNKEGDTMVFTVRLEQPFLAEEFEKSNYLRLQSDDRRAYLIYPKETQFEQKHAEFYGRLRGEGKVTLRLAYEIVSENLDGTRKVETREGRIEVVVPAEQAGSPALLKDWAQQQNQYFAELLRYYPDESFFQYCLLQSKARYGVDPPPIPSIAASNLDVETTLYQYASGSLAIQESLQREALSAQPRVGDLSVHISTLSPPALKSLPYEKLLDEKRTKERIEPAPHEVAKLIPEDQYLLHFNSMRSLGELYDLWDHWGDSLLRLFTIRAQDPRVQSKLETQLCLRRGPLTKLFADAVISEVAISGADPFVLEGTDVTMIFRVKRPEVFRAAAAGWLAEVRQQRPDVVDREFNYRGHKVATHYTADRAVSSFVVERDDYVIFSNSHRAIRSLIDTAAGLAPSLHDSLDYRYVTTILPPSNDAATGYFFASEAMIRRLVGPEAKISEKRRLQCFNNLVMLNNASLFFRLEYGRSPTSLSELVEQRFVDASKVLCPHGGAYAFDAQSDTCTCSLHNRLRHLTPNAELTVLKISPQEAAEYNRYKDRYAAFWQQAFDPIAIRFAVGPRVKIETCVLPLANSTWYNDLRSMVAQKPLPLSTANYAPSSVVSAALVPGREKIADLLRVIPGVAETLKANPTLTDLKWLGDRMALHYCDGDAILEIDPTALGAMKAPMLGDVPLQLQAVAAALLTATELPVYVTIDVENKDAAAQLLDQLSRQIFLEKEHLLTIPTTLDAYRLPDYKGHPIYVFSGQVYAFKLRLHAALVGDQLVAATKPEVLREVIDAREAKAGPATTAHILLRLNGRGLARLRDDVELHWAEKSRLACHHNVGSIYNLCKLYEAPVEQVPRLSESKYGVTYFCPEGGTYLFRADRDEVVCDIHGNRAASLQHLQPRRDSSFLQFIEGIDEVTAALEFRGDSLLSTVEIVRAAKK